MNSLSICPGCGTMMNDSVREELASKIVSPVNSEKKLSQSFSEKIMPSRPVQQTQQNSLETSPKLQAQSPNLIEFPTKTVEIPAWKLELQSRVKSHIEEKNNPVQSKTFTRRKVTSSRASTAVALEVIEEEKNVNPTLAKALQRIAISRQANAHLIETEEPENYTGKPYLVDAPKITEEVPAVENIAPIFEPKPRTEDRIPRFAPERMKSPDIAPRKIEIEQFDEFEPTEGDFLPIKSLENPEVSATEKKQLSIPTSVFRSKTVNMGAAKILENKPALASKIEFKADSNSIVKSETEEIDDVASFNLRFNAALFDLIIGAFASLILLAPFMLLGGKWFTMEGFFAFLATAAIVMFGYLTITIGLFGRTFGMKLFSLEMIDAEVNDIPTFNQAAISSSVYLLSLGLFGIGFLTMFFNAEKRLGHDIVSNTLVIHEI